MSNLFEELSFPEGRDLHWYVLTVAAKTSVHGNNKWLKTDNTISSSVNIPSEFYYDTKLEALLAIERYYAWHFVIFPYYKELKKLMQSMPEQIIDDDDSDGQRVMRFA